MRVKLLIVDNHSIFRHGVRVSLADCTNIEIVAEAESTAQAIQKSDSLLPDVIVIDAILGRESGLDLTKQLRRRHPQTGIVILTDRIDDEQLFQSIRAGAAAYATKEIDASELADLVRRVAAGDYLINDSVMSRPRVASRVLDEFREISVLDESASGVFSPLTPREIEILDQIAQGNTNKEIAYNLGISDQTVKNHITSILRKLAVNDRTQAVIFALRHGWIDLDDYPEPETKLRAVR